MWRIYTIKYYSAIKRNKIRSLAEIWMDPESVRQREETQKEKTDIIY